MRRIRKGERGLIYPYFSGTIKYIKDVNLGDILEDGTFIESTMQIDNKREPVPLYVIENAGVNGENIYVTGSHLVYDESIDKFNFVEKYNKAKMSEVSTDLLCCLITSNHMIPIGTEIFWDWEDHFFKL